MAKRRSQGEGSIFWSEKENTWIAQITLPDGTKKRKRSKRQKIVREWLQTSLNQLKEGVFIVDDRITVSALLDRYIEDVASPSLRPKTLESYLSLINNHINPGLGGERVTKVSASQLQSFYTSLREKGLSERTVQFCHSIIHKLLATAMKWELVSRNVADLVEKPKVKRKAPKIWTTEQANRFLSLVKDHRFHPIYVLAIATGAREGELLGIHHEEINWESGTIHIKHAVQYLVGKGVVLTEPKTELAKRPIPLPDYALTVLREHCERQSNKQGFVFVTKNNTPFSPRNLVRHFKEVIKENGLPDIRFHDLRHYHASFLLSRGVNPKVVQERLGHSQISLTMDTYSHTIPSLQADAARKANEIFNP
jgi:integrase